MRPLVLLAGLASVSLSGAALAHGNSLPQCATILPPGELPPGRRSLAPEDLTRLRDIGPAEAQYFAAPFFTLSPDGRRAAFQLRQGDPQRNLYCVAMVVVDLTRRSPPQIIDEGGEPILLTIDLRNVPDLPNGNMRVITPRWSADGKWIAFLKQEQGRTEVWRAFADGSGSQPLTHSGVNVTDFRIGGNGSSIIYVTRPGIERERQEIDKEGLNGWHYDDRFAPWISKRPFPHATADRQVEVLDIPRGPGTTGTTCCARPRPALQPETIGAVRDHEGSTANENERRTTIERFDGLFLACCGLTTLTTTAAWAGPG